MAGKKLPYMEANLVLRNILTAMTASNATNSEEIVIGQKDDEEILANPIDDSKNDGAKKTEVIVSTPDAKIITPQIPINGDGNVNKVICHFYTFNKCKFGKECRKAHPKICPMFKKHGIKKFKKFGCEENCENYHPKACFEAMKNKTCKRPECKFFHVSGTKKTEIVFLL